MEKGQTIKLVLLVILGIVLGCVAYEGIMFGRVARLRNQNPTSTSMMETKAQEARTRGEEPAHEQIWVSLEKISPNLQRAVLAGEDTNFATHHGFDYQAIQKAWERAQQDAQKDLDNRKQRAGNQIGKKMIPIIDKLSREKGLSAVAFLNQQFYAWVDPSLVITEEVVKAYNAVYNAAHPAAAPAAGSVPPPPKKP